MKQNITASYFNSANDTTPKDIDLLEWLSWTINPPKEYENAVLNYRKTLLRKDKIKIPCITPSAAFKNHRELEDIKHKNAIICFDIDRFAKSKKSPQNPCIDLVLVKEFVRQHPACLYAGFSCSGNDSGLYVIMRIGHSDRLIDYFEYFQKSFVRHGINIDPSCKDYTRCRFFSIDKEAYFNPDAKVFILKDDKEKPSTQLKSNSNTGMKILDDLDKAWVIVKNCEANSIDITSDYSDWAKIAAALNNSFGEDGRVIFHRLSAIYTSYNYDECNKKYDQCKKMNKVTLSSLFYIASSYGVKY